MTVLATQFITSSRCRLAAIVCIAQLLALMIHHQALLADAPQVQRIFPSGGMRGQSLEVELKGKLADRKLEVWSSRPGLKWESKEDAAKFQVAIEADAEPGLVLVRFFDAQGASALQRFVIGSIPEINEREPNNRVSESQPIDADPLLINGILEKSGDVDMYAVRLTSGQTLVATVDAERLLNSPVDACLQIVDDHGNVRAMNLDHHGLDPHLSWTVPSDGLYCVRVFGFPAAPDSSIRLAGGENYLYRLTLTTGPYLEAAVPLAVSSTVATTLEPHGWNTATAPAPLQVEPVAQSDRPSGDGYLAMFAGITGWSKIPIVSASIYRAPSVSDEPATPIRVDVPASITGCLAHPNAEDVFLLNVKKGERIVASVDSRSLGYPLDATLRVESTNGKQLASEDDQKTNRDPVLRWTAPEEGGYRLVVSEVNRMAVPHGYYRLTVAREEPGFAVTTSADLLTTKINQPLAIPLSITRLNGFDGRLTFSLVEPPPGLKAEPVTSEAKGDTAKEVKWNVTATEPFNGPIRIAVSSEGGGANASSPAFVTASDSQLEDLWLVALP